MDQLSSSFLHGPENFAPDYAQKQALITSDTRELYSKHPSTSGAHSTSDLYRPWMNTAPSTSHPIRDHSNLPQLLLPTCYEKYYSSAQENCQTMAESCEISGTRPERKDLEGFFVKGRYMVNPCMNTAQIIGPMMDTSSGYYNISQTGDHSERFKCTENSQPYSINKPVTSHPVMETIQRFTQHSSNCKGQPSAMIRNEVVQVKDNQKNILEFPEQAYSSPLSIRVGLLHLQFNSVLSTLVKNTAEWSTIHQLQTMYETVASDIHSQHLKMTYSQSGNDLNKLSPYHKTMYETLITKVETSLTKFQINRKYAFNGKEVITQSAKVSKGSYMEDLMEKCASRGYLQPKVKQSELPAKAINIMSTWFHKNAEYPYPSSEAYQLMSAAGNITVTQARKWFANKRIRSGFTKGLKASKREAEETESQPKRMKLL